MPVVVMPVVVITIVGFILAMGFIAGRAFELEQPSGNPILFLCSKGKDPCRALMVLDSFEHCEGAKMANPVTLLKSPTEELYCVSESAFK